MTDINFGVVNAAALAVLPSLLRRWLPDGKLVGREFEARNPTRADNRRGSFRINIETGKWSDFAIGDKGGDPVSLAAYIAGTGQVEAAQNLTVMLGVTNV